MKLGEHIYHLRKQKGFSQEQLAEEINVTRQTISNWELDSTSPNPEQLKLLSKTLSVSIDELLDNIAPNKDVDGFRKDSCFESCTPKGIIDWLKYNNYDLTGKQVTVLGRSKIVGKPLVNMLIDRGSTVISCNSHTENIEKYTQGSDLVISAVGKANLFCCEMPENGIVVDVGINHDIDGKLCGDVNRKYVENNIKNTYVTSVPGGVGLLTRVALLDNVIKACETRKE